MEDFMYTWGDIKNITLAKLDLDESEANQIGYLNRFAMYANEAMIQICSSVKPKKNFAVIEVADDMIGKLHTINDEDFIAFNDDIPKIIENSVVREAHDEDFIYCGYNQILPYKSGTYYIPYNARWLTFSGVNDVKTNLDAPADVLVCIPSYIASQCMKVDDDYKASALRNEFEILLARIDDTDYKSTKTFTIGGDW